MPNAGSEDPIPTETRLHASVVAVEGRGLLLLGPSGSGKSALALDLIALGATLVADDQTLLRIDRGRLLASPHPNIAGRIEARHVGLLRLPHLAEAEVHLVVDLGKTELHRLPPLRTLSLLEHDVTLLHRPPGASAASALLQCLMLRRETP